LYSEAQSEQVIFVFNFHVIIAKLVFVDESRSMFPLSCARVRTLTSCEMSAHKKTWSAHKCFLHMFHTHRSKINTDESW